MPVFKLALIATLLAGTVIAVPRPQDTSQACVNACTAVGNAAQASSSSSSPSQNSILQCICSSSGFTSNAQTCLTCAGVSSDQIATLQQFLASCGAVVSSGGAAYPTTTAAGSSSAVATSAPVTSASSVATSVPSSGSVALVTGSAPVTISAWIGNNGNASLHSYVIAATGGANTTIEAIYTTTGVAATNTVTLDWVLGPTAILGVADSGPYEDIIYCQISNGTTVTNGTPAQCREYYYSGNALLSATTFSLTGKTTPWVAYPTTVTRRNVTLTSTSAQASVTGLSASGGLDLPTSSALSG